MTALGSNPSAASDHSSPHIRLLDPSDPDFAAATALALGIQPASPDLEAFRADTSRRGLEIAFVGAVFDDTVLVDAAMLLRSPGNSALSFFSCAEPHRKSQVTQLLALLRQRAEQRCIRLLEILLEPNATIKSQIAAEAGFTRLTRLEYLNRRDGSPVAARATNRALTWVPYAENSQAAFAETVRKTYAQSQDCPELTNIRSMDDVLADHRAAGEFDPAHWQLAVLGDVPVGVLLMSRIENQHAFEIVYMGVAPQARASGVGDALINRAIEVSTTTTRGRIPSSPPSLVLAVDQRNEPAKGLYRRWGFVSVGARDAWIATSSPTRG